jgi:isochorismate hydrolase
MLIAADRSLLLVVDVQEKFMPTLYDREVFLSNCARLMRAASQVGVPVLVSEQYPKGLGPTVEPLRGLAPEGSIREKLHFCCVEDEDLRGAIRASGRDQVIIAGIEAHICVLQTALGLVRSDLQPIVVADAVSGRRPESTALALDRMRANGVEVVDVEMVLFEWMHRAGTEAFKRLHGLVTSPEAEA